MQLFFFWLFAALMIVCGGGVIANRNPIASALNLVLSFIGLAALFIMLDAYFIGIIQVLVYAGAVMVLFLFIIMLLDLRAEERRKINRVAFIGGSVVALVLFAQIVYVVRELGASGKTFPPLSMEQADDVRALGLLLFDQYNFPFQIIGVLLLVVTIGVVVLSKRELR